LSFLGNPEPGVPVKNLYLETDLGAVDLLSSIQGVGDFARVRADSIEIDLFGRRCRVISLDDLIRAKEALGREKDLLAVKELKALREKQAKS
jgi:predicted nucleotidyltransferase